MIICGDDDILLDEGAGTTWLVITPDTGVDVWAGVSLPPPLFMD